MNSQKKLVKKVRNQRGIRGSQSRSAYDVGWVDACSAILREMKPDTKRKQTAREMTNEIHSIEQELRDMKPDAVCRTCGGTKVLSGKPWRKPCPECQPPQEAKLKKVKEDLLLRQAESQALRRQIDELRKLHV